MVPAWDVIWNLKQ